jgi:IS30 family transposase
MGYKHLNIDERESILKMLSEQKNITHIAELLGRNKGTISRDLSRNRSSTGEYKPHLAQRYYNKRRAESKHPYRLEQNGKLRQYIRKKLKQYWSPEQIAGRLKRDHKIDISPVTIYSWIKREKSEGGRLYKFLRQSNRKRRKRYGSQEKRGQIPDRRLIDQRPKVVNERKRIGDWESDTVVGKGRGSYIASHVERKSRYTVIAKMKDKSTKSMNLAIRCAFRKIPADKLKTMTFDNGKEFAGFKELEKLLGMRSYFANAYHSWERGTNENTNGLLRQFFPKGTDFHQVSHLLLYKVAELLNNRPRKCLNYRTPAEVFWRRKICCASD